MLEVAEDAAEVGRCDADAICASDRAASVKPTVVSCSVLDSQILVDRQPYTSALGHASPSSAQVLGSLTTVHCTALDPIVLDIVRPSRSGALSRRSSWCCASLFRIACYRRRMVGAKYTQCPRTHTNITAFFKRDFNRTGVKAAMGGREVKDGYGVQAWRGKARYVIGWNSLTGIIQNSSIFRNIRHRTPRTKYTCRSKPK
jgi:hypothetical protein